MVASPRFRPEDAASTHHGGIMHGMTRPFAVATTDRAGCAPRRPKSLSVAVSLMAAALLPLSAAAAFAEIFACTSNSEVRVFADDAGVSALPIRTIAGPSTGIAECYGLALDNWHNELWVTTQSTIRVFHATDDGDVAPLRTITGFGFAISLAVDVEADEVYVGTVGGAVFVYSRTASGSPTPLHSIQGGLTGLATVAGLFVDRVNDELYVENYSGSVAVFARSADGNVAPLRPFASFTRPFGLVVDPWANEVFVASGDAAIKVHNRTGAALRQIAGSGTFLTQSTGLCLLEDGTVLAGNQFGSATTNDAVFGYPRAQNGAASPTFELLFAAPLTRAIWGIASTHAFECGEGQTASRCLFRNSFEGGDLSDWSASIGVTP